MGRWMAIALLLVAAGGCSTQPANDKKVAEAVVDETPVANETDDRTLHFQIGSALADDEAISDQVHVSVMVMDGRVLLSGEAPSEELKARSGELAAGIAGVKQLYNELAVQEVTTLLQRSRDSWITAKVKNALIGDKAVSGERIGVVTERGVVYLMGVVSRQQGDIAARLAAYISGVERVVKLFEYR